ncbi:endonuclease 8-like 1 isoform X3 [Manis pentadactyla]|uniref:endonuclease 8-like 1 isoform X3 n=1 Tax=Manis pentadactyla TaxID=143292 RepID=UPI00255CD283|nr:endonuclease 8-like 1 isoform X3 [Manis pentadactyla]
MPEGPELHLASHFVNEACKGLVFGGCVDKSPVSRNPEVPFESSAYCISASARGKELRLTLSPLPGAQPPQEPLALIFHFGMSGSFQLAPGDALPPHAHLRFYTAPPGPRLALCFVDIRRFGRWDLGGQWQPGRGPCVLLEYEQFRLCPPRKNVLRNLADKAFDRPICEALLDQRFFNGIGNYLRAEILHRLKVPPFQKARTVLEALRQRRQSPELTLSQKIRAKLWNPDLLELCHSVPKEVVQLGEVQKAKMASHLCFGILGQRLRARAWGGGLCCLSCLAAVLQHPRHELSAGPARPHHLVPGGCWTPGTQRTLHFQASPVPGHAGHGEALLGSLEPSSPRRPASSRIQKTPQSLERGRGWDDWRPRAAAEPRNQRSRLIPYPWSLRGRQTPSRMVSFLASTSAHWTWWPVRLPKGRR